MHRILLLALVCASATVAAQDFALRADEGERIMATEAGDAYLASLAPTLEQSIRTCSDEGARMSSGEAVAIVARVARDGTWSAVETQSDSSASRCLARRLQASPLPPPAQWPWEQDEFPLTLSIGAGRGTINGLRQDD